MTLELFLVEEVTDRVGFPLALWATLTKDANDALLKTKNYTIDSRTFISLLP
jgi:hypothetical protein